MFLRRESEGEYPADRLETVLSAIYHCVFWSACFHGMNPASALKYICEPEVTRPKKWREPTPEQRRLRAEAEDRRLFAAIADRFNEGQGHG